MPVLEVDGKEIPQSYAIFRYLAKEHGELNELFLFYQYTLLKPWLFLFYESKVIRRTDNKIATGLDGDYLTGHIT